MCQENWKKEDLTALNIALKNLDKRLENYTQKHGKRLIAAIKNSTENTRNNRTTITRKQKWEEKQLNGRFKRLISNISHEKTWT